MYVLPARVTAYRANLERYQKLLGEINAKGYQIEMLPKPEGFFSNRWLTTVTIDPYNNNGITREDLRLALEADNIESRPL